MDKVGNFLSSKYGWEFTVQGRNIHSRFPIDMLRYDRAYPANTEAVTALAEKTKNMIVNSDKITKNKVIKLRTTKGTITPARWKSLGWIIKEAFELTKEGTPKSEPSYK